MHVFLRHVEVRQVGQSLIVYFTRPRIVESSEIENLVEELREVIHRFQPSNVILNLQNVVFLPSAVLSHLVMLRVRLGKQGRGFALCSLRPEIAEILRIAALDRWFAIYPDEQEALVGLASRADSPSH